MYFMYGVVVRKMKKREEEINKIVCYYYHEIYISIISDSYGACRCEREKDMDVTKIK